MYEGGLPLSVMTYMGGGGALLKSFQALDRTIKGKGLLTS